MRKKSWNSSESTANSWILLTYLTNSLTWNNVVTGKTVICSFVWSVPISLFWLIYCSFTFCCSTLAWQFVNTILNIFCHIKCDTEEDPINFCALDILMQLQHQKMIIIIYLNCSYPELLINFYAFWKGYCIWSLRNRWKNKEISGIIYSTKEKFFFNNFGRFFFFFLVC